MRVHSHLPRQTSRAALLSAPQVEHRWWRINVGGEDEQKQRPIVMQRKSPQHPAWLAVSHVNIFVARAVAVDFERRDDIAELSLKLILWPEYEPANVRMQTVRADHQIEPTLAAVFELNLHTVRCS